LAGLQGITGLEDLASRQDCDPLQTLQNPEALTADPQGGTATSEGPVTGGLAFAEIEPDLPGLQVGGLGGVLKPHRCAQPVLLGAGVALEAGGGENLARLRLGPAGDTTACQHGAAGLQVAVEGIPVGLAHPQNHFRFAAVLLLEGVEAARPVLQLGGCCRDRSWRAAP
jgi:hypothetical protein